MSDWYYEKDGERVGPVTQLVLQDLLETGLLRDDALVWTAGMETWAPAHAASALPKRTPTSSAGRPQSVVAPPSIGGVAPTHDLGKWTVVMFRVAAGISAFLVVAYLAAIGRGDWIGLLALWNGEVSGPVDVLIMLQSLAAMVLFLVWLYRATANLQLAQASPLAVSPGWAIGSFFVPFVNLYAPLKGLQQLRSQVGGPTESAVNTWWWLFAGALTCTILALIFLSDAAGAGDMEDFAVLVVISEALFAAAALAGAQCIQQLNDAMGDKARQTA